MQISVNQSFAQAARVILNPMIITIDESGVHKQQGKSTIALVYVATDDVEAMETLVRQVEATAHLHSFHWAHRNWLMREAFIRGIAAGDFRIKIAYIANPILLDKALAQALTYLLTERNISQILIDGQKPKAYLLQLKKTLRDKGVTVKKIRAVNDESYPLIRIADAVAGAARTARDDPASKASTLLALLKDKIDVQIDL